MLRLLFVSWLCLTLLCLPACAVEIPYNNSSSVSIQNVNYPKDEFQTQRLQMIEKQIRARGIKNKAVLKAMSKVPRHLFVDRSFADLAYQDHPLPLAHNQTISQPYIVAYMTEAAEIAPKDKVLEIGTGSGYQAAVLGELAKEVYTIEIIPQLAKSARKTLSQLGYRNVHVKTGNGYEGWAEYAPYNKIIVTAAPEDIPEALVQQLAINGKMVIPVGSLEQEMMVITKTPNGLRKEKTIPVRFVPMTGHSPNVR
jgi:protein-L-isoaspartate(D-aspartate) O-methyltransferase